MKNLFDVEQDLSTCDVAVVLPIINSKWIMPIVYYLSFGNLRFSELKHKLPPMADSNYSKVLKSMENYGLIKRHDFKEMPPRVEYSITELGRKMIPIMKELEVFGQTYVDTIHNKEQDENS